VLLPSSLRNIETFKSRARGLFGREVSRAEICMPQPQACIGALPRRVETRRSKRHNAASIVPNNTSLVQSKSCRWQPKRWISIVV
jgi:hypothetical protein